MPIVEELHRLREQTSVCFELPESRLALRYGSGKWSVREVLHHLADTEVIYYDRLCRIISEPAQTLKAFEQDRWADRLDYAHRPMEISRAIFESVRTGIISLARGHYERDGQLEYVHSRQGPGTLKGAFDKVVSHNANHLEQIRQALGGESRAR